MRSHSLSPQSSVLSTKLLPADQRRLTFHALIRDIAPAMLRQVQSGITQAIAAITSDPIPHATNPARLAWLYESQSILTTRLLAFQHQASKSPSHQGESRPGSLCLGGLGELSVKTPAMGVLP